MLDSMLLEKMKSYKGLDESPKKFTDFWEKSILEVKNHDSKYNLLHNNITTDFADCFDLTFQGIDQSEIYAKVIFPKEKNNFPVMFKFHGYQGRSSDWSESFKFVASGIGVVMMDVRGQAGLSNDCSIHSGNTVKGHIIRGIQDGPNNLFYKLVYQDIKLLTQIISSLPQVDEKNMMAYGKSQGGALALIAAALTPQITKVFSVYPFLSDFRRVLELKYNSEAYDELHRYFKFYDPFYQTESQAFETLGFIDIKNFAHMINGKVTMLCGLQDEVCPPSTQFATYNRIESEKEMLLLPEYGHEELNVKVPDMIYSWATNIKIY